MRQKSFKINPPFSMLLCFVPTSDQSVYSHTYEQNQISCKIKNYIHAFLSQTVLFLFLKEKKLVHLI